MISPERRSEIMFQNVGTSDCGVIALQAITGLTRDEAMKVAVELAGYQEGVGVWRGRLNAALDKLGYKVEKIGINHGDTPATFAVTHEYGVFLLYTDGHVMVLREGDLLNAKGEWRAPLEEAHRVVAP